MIFVAVNLKYNNALHYKFMTSTHALGAEHKLVVDRPFMMLFFADRKELPITLVLRFISDAIQLQTKTCVECALK